MGLGGPWLAIVSIAILAAVRFGGPFGLDVSVKFSVRAGRLREAEAAASFAAAAAAMMPFAEPVSFLNSPHIVRI